MKVNNVLSVVVVGVLDTGIDYTHPIFGNCVIHNDVNYSGDGYAKDDVCSYHPHGTATAGIVADLTMENVLVKPYKVLGYKGTGYESGICAGRLAAIDADVDVINMSREDIVSNLINHATDMGEKYLTLSMVMDC